MNIGYVVSRSKMMGTRTWSTQNLVGRSKMMGTRAWST